MAVRKPSPQLKAFGKEMNRLREEAGISRTELARLTSVTRSYISQVETGNTRCRRDFAERLDKALGTGTQLQDAWDELVKTSRYPKWFVDYPRAEGTAAILRAFENMHIYGLFQTEAYMRVLLQSKEDVEGRLRRQAVLNRETLPLINVVLTESVVWTCVGSAQIMRQQCERLLSVSEESNVTLQIAPTAHYRGCNGHFNLATQASGDELLYMETVTGGVTSSERKDILHVVGAFSALQARALSVDDSREFLRKAIVRWTS